MAGEGDARSSGSPKRCSSSACERRAVEAFRRLGLVGLEGLALHEQALAGEDRRQLMVARRQRPRLPADAEQTGDEILEMGPRRSGAPTPPWRRARLVWTAPPSADPPDRHRPRRDRRQEPIDTGQALWPVKIGKAQSMVSVSSVITGCKTSPGTVIVRCESTFHELHRPRRTSRQCGPPMGVAVVPVGTGHTPGPSGAICASSADAWPILPDAGGKKWAFANS